MTRGVQGDVPDGGVRVVHHGDGKDVVQKLRVKIPLPRRGAGDDGRGGGVQAQLDRDKPLLAARCRQALAELRQKLGGDFPVHQQHLLRVADRGAAGLGVFDDIEGLVLIGRLVDKDVADAGAGLDAGDLRVFGAAADEARAAPGDEQVHIAHGPHELVGARVRCILDKADEGGGKARVLEAVTDGRDDGGVGAVSLAPAAQDDGVAGFERQHRRVRGDVRAAFVDDGDHAQRYGGLLDHKPVRAHHAPEYPSLRVGKRRHLAHAPRHAFNARRCQGEPVHHHIAVAVLRALHVQAVGGKDLVLLRDEPVRDGEQGRVLSLFRRCQQRQRGFGFFQDFMGRLPGVSFLPINFVPTGFPSSAS